MPTSEQQVMIDQLKKDLAGALERTEIATDNLGGAMETWMKTWMSTNAPASDAYKREVFDSYGVVHYSPKDGASKPRYGWQAVLNGPLFESRKEFRSLRLAKLWVKQQMKCKCWPTTTDSAPHAVNEGIVNMTITFDYDGPLDKSFLVKNDSFR